MKLILNVRDAKRYLKTKENVNVITVLHVYNNYFNGLLPCWNSLKFMAPIYTIPPIDYEN